MNDREQAISDLEDCAPWQPETPAEPFNEGQHLVSRVVSIEPDRPDDLAETVGELVCEQCFVEGRG